MRPAPAASAEGLRARLRWAGLTTLALAALAARAGPARAQVILNAEQLEPRDTVGLQYALQGSLSLRSGNAQVTDIAGAGAVGYRTGHHWLRLIGGLEHLSGRSETLLDSRYLHLRYSYLLSPRARTFHFWQIQSNRALLLKRRLLLGSGIRYALESSPAFELDVGTGLMLELERAARSASAPDDVVSHRAVRMANLAVARTELGPGASASLVLYYQPDVAAFNDYRALADAALSAPLASHVHLGLSLEWRHDSRPPLGVRPDDLALKTMLSLSPGSN